MKQLAASAIVAALTVGGMFVTGAAANAAPVNAPTPNSGPVTGGTAVTVPIPKAPSEVKFTALAASSRYAYALDPEGNAYKIQIDKWGQNDLLEKVSMPSGVKFTDIAAGASVAYALGDDGNTYSWGYNYYGQLGNGTTVDSDVPQKVAVPSGVKFTAIAGGTYDAFALGNDGNAYAWGSGTYGSLGTGTLESSTVPLKVKRPAGVWFTGIAGGEHSGYALGDDGNAYAWGGGGNGNLGDGYNANSDVPVKALTPAGVKFVSISANKWNAYALGNDGNAYAWGSGQLLGNGSDTKSNVPVKVTLPAGVKFTSMKNGSNNGYALGNDGNVYAWGNGSYGRLGDGIIHTSYVPVRVMRPAGLQFTAIAAGGGTGYALGDDGNVYAWGEVGDRGMQRVPVTLPIRPVQVTRVLFGGAPASEPIWNDDATVTVTAPLHRSGVVDVTVEWTAAGVQQSPVVYSRGYTYNITTDVTVFDDRTNGAGAPGATITVSDEHGTTKCGPVQVTTDGFWSCAPGAKYLPGIYTVSQNASGTVTTTSFTVTDFSVGGRVSDSFGTPVSGAIVSAGGKSVTTGTDGRYLIDDLPAGAIRVWVSPPANTSYNPTEAYVEVGAVGVTRDFTLAKRADLPSGTTAPNATFVNQSFNVTHHACVNAQAVTLTIGQNGQTVFSGTFTETSPGMYAITVPGMSSSGVYEMRIAVQCSGSSSADELSFNLYVDPAGTVKDTAGRPIEGATVVLKRSDTAVGDFAVVPDGDPIMSPSNRVNPYVTGKDGKFAWDVIPGYYLVEASAPNCTAPGKTAKTVSTDVLPVPPEYLDLELLLECAPTVAADIAPVVSGKLSSGVVGEKYRGNVTATGTPKPTFSVSSGKLPTGLALNKNDGLVSGTPSVAGTFKFSVTATNKAGVDSKSFTISIGPAKSISPRRTAVFADVPVNHKFYREIDWMERAKLSTGTKQAVGKPLYKPSDDLTREAMAAFIYRLEQPKGYQAPIASPFADVKPGDKFYTEISWMYEAGLSTGTRQDVGKPLYAPKDSLSREAMAAFIYRLEAKKDTKVKNYQMPTVSPLVDLRQGAKFYKEISWMYSAKLTTGVNTKAGKEYQPKVALTRQAMAAFIYRLVVNYRN